MTSEQAIVAFALAAGLLTIVPGVDMALLLRTAAADGTRSAMAVAAGVCTGLLIWALLVAAGLGALVSVSHAAYDALRIVGAAYLAYLGIGLLFRRTTPQAVASSRPRRGRAYGRGLLCNLLNPKVGVFYATFFPQFIAAGVNVVAFSALLATIHLAETVIWFAVLIAATKSIAGWLQSRRFRLVLDRCTGVVLLLLGVRLALERRE